MNYIRIPYSLTKVGLHALPNAVLVLESYSPLADKYPKNRYIYWDGNGPLEKLEERVASHQKKQKRAGKLAVSLFSLFLAFGIAMLAGLFLKNTRVLTIGWIGAAFFGVIIFIWIKKDSKKN